MAVTVADAHVRVHHPCPYCDVSVEFPRTLFLLWCDNRRDVFLVSAPELKELRAVLRTLRSSFDARPLIVDGNDAIVANSVFEWPNPPSVTRLARRGGVWVLHPVVYYGGTETYRFVAPTKRILNRLITRLRRFGDVEILSVSEPTGLAGVRDLPVASVHFFEGLTERQARSLVAAYEGGLFDIPARSKWDDVARREGLSRSTFGEHLRKGQHHLLANSLASLKARISVTGGPVILPSTAPSRAARRSSVPTRRVS